MFKLLFGNTPKWFANLPVGRKLALGFGAVVAISLLVEVVAQVASSLEDQYRLAANESQAEVTIAEETEISLLEARRREKDFQLRYRNEGFDAAYQSYVVSRQQAVQTSLDLIANLRSRTEEENYARLDQAAQNLATYNENADLFVDAVQQRGLQGESGIVFAAFESLEALLDRSDNLGAEPVHAAADEARAALIDYDLVMLPGTQARDPEQALAEYETSRTRVNQSLDTLSARINSSDISESDKSRLQSDLRDARTAIDALAALDLELLGYRNTSLAAIDEVDPLLVEIIEFENGVFEADNALFETTAQTATVVEVSLLAFELVLAVSIALVTTFAFVRQTDAFKPVLAAIRVGDFDTRAEIYSQDELGKAADAVNALLDFMINLLRGSLARMESIVQSAPDAIILVNQDTNIALFNPAAENIFGIPVSAAMGLPVGQIAPKLLQAINTQPVLKGTAMRQSLELVGIRGDGSQIPMEGTISSVEVSGETLYTVIVRDVTVRQDLQSNVTEMVELLVAQATSSASMAEQASSSAQEGSLAVGETIAAMSRIRDNTQETAHRIKRLGEVSSEIGEAVQLIEGLADRTTVLALNASIQAAAAGEAGRGFAVVAEEVQRLAERATSTTRQIEGLVKNIQTETSEAVIGIEEATREVVDGSNLAQQTGDRVGELSRLVTDLASLIQHVAATTANQTTQSLAALTSGALTVETGNGNGGNGHSRVAAGES